MTKPSPIKDCMHNLQELDWQMSDRFASRVTLQVRQEHLWDHPLPGAQAAPARREDTGTHTGFRLLWHLQPHMAAAYCTKPRN